MTRRALVVAGAGTLAAALVVVLAAASLAEQHSSSDDDAQAWSRMIDDARSRTATRPFSGTIEVDWRDAKGEHHVALDVRHANGAIEVIAGARVVAQVRDGVMVAGDVWTALAGRVGAPPALEPGKYRIVRRPGPVVADRSTTRYDATRRGAVVERVYVDDDSRLVVRKETVDARGRVTRAVAFTKLHDDAGAESMPSVPVTVPRRTPKLVADVGAPYRDPTRVGDGFRLVARFRHSSRVVQLFYSDGLLDVSVFEQPGHVDWSALPTPDATAEIAGRGARRYALPVGEALVFQRGGVVYTCVGDAPSNELAAIAADVSSRRDHVLARVARLVLSPFRW